MNDKQRKQLKSAISDLEKAKDLIEQAREILNENQEAEQEKYDNLTEGLQAAENGQKLESFSENLSDTVSEAETLTGDIDALIESIQRIIDGDI